MRLNVQHHNLRSTNELDSLVEDCILALQPRWQIDEAHVRLECHFASSPAFNVHIHLVTPDTGVFAEGRDHTIRAAVRKAMSEIKSKLGHRDMKRQRRVRSDRQALAIRARNGPARR